jgi:SAM-dependent methyltransferase
MNDRDAISRRMREHFEDFWSAGDPWQLEQSALDQTRYARQHALVNDRRYARALDLGCGSGQFTRLLADVADHVVGVDIAQAAIDRAAVTCRGKHNVELRVANVMDDDYSKAESWDLIVMTESIYCLGWLYPMFDVGWLVSELLGSMRAGGRFLLVNTLGTETDYLLLPWLIKTYRDLFLNVGYELEREESLRGTKNGVELEVAMSLLRKPAAGNP